MGKPMRVTKTAKEAPGKPMPKGAPMQGGKKPGLVVMIGIGKPKGGKK